MPSGQGTWSPRRERAEQVPGAEWRVTWAPRGWLLSFRTQLLLAWQPLLLLGSLLLRFGALLATLGPRAPRGLHLGGSFWSAAGSWERQSQAVSWAGIWGRASVLEEMGHWGQTSPRQAVALPSTVRGGGFAARGGLPAEGNAAGAS